MQGVQENGLLGDAVTVNEARDNMKKARTLLKKYQQTLNEKSSSVTLSSSSVDQGAKGFHDRDGPGRGGDGEAVTTMENLDAYIDDCNPAGAR